MDSINILISVNRNFFNHVEELLFSILYYSTNKVHIYLMYQEHELTADDISHIISFVQSTGKGNVIPIKFDTDFLSGMPITDNEGAFFGMEAYSRLFCAFNLPNNVSKILYLDADMICTGNINELYDIDFDEKTWIACEDKGIKISDLERLGLSKKHKYINSGVLLLNIPKFKNSYTKSNILNLIKNYQEILVYPDQDFINKVFANDIKIIDSKYNLIAKDVRYKDLTLKPLIIHYAGSAKPWDNDVSRFDKEFLEPYYEILKLQGANKKKILEEILENHKMYGYHNSKL